MATQHREKVSRLNMSALSGLLDPRPEELDTDFGEGVGGNTPGGSKLGLAAESGGKKKRPKAQKDPKNPGGYLGDISEIDAGETPPKVSAEDPDLEAGENGENSASGVYGDDFDPFEVAKMPEVEIPPIPLATIEQPFQFRVYSHNIKNGAHAEYVKGEQPWEERRADVAASIRMHARDSAVVVLQEALLFQLEYILEQLNLFAPKGRKWAAYGGGRIDGRSIGEHVPVLVREDQWEVPYHDTFWLNEENTRMALTGWDAKYPRICTVATLRHRASGAYINVFNTHFDHKGSDARIQAALLIVERMETLNEWPSLLTGDLNLTPNEDCYETLAESLTDVRTLTAPYNRYGHRLFTVTGFLGGRGTVGQRIDYIFVPKYASRLSQKPCGLRDGKKPGPLYLQVQEYGLLHSKFGGTYMSDHRPVVVDFELGSC